MTLTKMAGIFKSLSCKYVGHDLLKISPDFKIIVIKQNNKVISLELDNDFEIKQIEEHEENTIQS